MKLTLDNLKIIIETAKKTSDLPVELVKDDSRDGQENYVLFTRVNIVKKKDGILVVLS